MSSQLKYLMQLIEDENPEVTNTVLEELLSFGPSLELELARQSLRPNAKQREILHGIFEEHNRQWLRFTWPKLFDIHDDTIRLEQGWEWLAAFQNGRLYPFKVKYLLDQVAHEYLQTHQEKSEVTLAQFLFGDNGFKANHHDYHSPLNSNLVYVMREKKGIPLSLASIYILVGERLGFHIEGYNFPGHFLAKINYNDRSVLVDCYNSGLLIDEKHLLFTSNLFSANLTEEDLRSSTNIILSRALRNLIRSYQDEPENAAFILQLLKDFEELRKEVEDDDRETPTSDHAVFHIGQLVKHTKYGYRGVVVDYDLKCKADDNWYYSNQTQPPREQPWYHVLVHTSTHNTYVAQNNLVADSSKQKIIHPLVYYFFSEFKDGEYLRNENNWPNQYQKLCTRFTEVFMSENTPKAKKIPKELTIHGDTRIDNYYWLNDRENPQVIDYLNDENAYTDKILEHTQDLQQKLYDEIIGRIKQQDESVPYYSNEYFYYVKFFEGKEYPVYCRKHHNLENEEQVILDVNVLAEGHGYYQVKGLNVSQDNTLVAFGVDTNGRRQYKLYIKNLESNEITDCEIENTVGGVAWANDNEVFFYAEKDPQSLRPNRILRYSLKTKECKVVYTENDNTFITFVYKTKSRKYIVIGCYSTVSTEYRFVDADNYEQDFRIIEPRKRDLEYSVDHYGEKFYIVTNDQAKNFKLVETSVENTTRENWQDVIAHRSDVFIEAIEIFKDFLVVEERQKGLPQLRIIKWDDKTEHYLDFGEPAYMAYISVNREFDTSLLRYGYTSLTTPNSTFDYDMRTKEKTLLKRQPVLGDFDRENYQCERIEATAEDGVKIPISLVYRKDKKSSDGNPFLLYAYGSYGHSIDPSFSSARLSLLDRGFIFAIAHIRGGQVMGRSWYEDGKLFSKKNTFTDFISCSKHVIDTGYTTKDLLFAEGGSAGGLLMGAIINMSDDLYRGIIAGVPFVDVVTTMLDDSIPLTTGEYDEWGNPNIKEYYEYMLSYSPYDNVTAKAYPNMLVTTGLHDSQVQYWEPAKWVAKLREMKTDDNLLLLHTDMDSGHGGASGRFKRHKLTALEFAFLFYLLGIKE